MADLSIQSIVEAGLEATYASCAAGGDTFANDGSEKQFLHVKNGDASDHTVTVTPDISSKDVRGYGTLTRANVAVVVTAGEERFIGPFPTPAFETPAITYDDVTSMTIAVLKI